MGPFWLVASAGAADLEIGDGRAYGSLEEALSVAQPGDRLLVDPGIYAPALILTDIEIAAVLPGQTVVAAEPGRPALEIAPAISATLRGLVLDGMGLNRALYAGIGSELIAEDLLLQGGVSETWGGCAHLDTMSATLRRSTITGCVAEAGGGIYAEDSALLLESVTVSDNTATSGFGGGIGTQRSQLIGRGVSFLDNLADDPIGLEHEKALGGGLFMGTDATLDLLGCTFSGNEARSVGEIAGRGGAIRLWLTDATIASCSLSGNRASEYGSAIAAASTSLWLSDSDLTNNLVTEPFPEGATYGGAVFCDEGSDCAVHRSWFQQNAAGDGGGIASIGALSVTTSMFCDNLAESDGGAIDVGNADADVSVSLLGNVFALNSAANEGGAIVASDGNQVFRNNHIVGNTAPTAAAVATTSLGTVAGLEFVGNLVASNQGSQSPALEIDLVPFVESHNWWYDNAPSTAAFPPGEGTQEGDPLLSGPMTSCDPGDLALGALSPLRDGGPPDIEQQDTDGSRNDIGGFGGPFGDESAFLDADGDTLVSMLDCDDTNGAIHRDAPEICNGLDDDCDGLVDEDDNAVDALWMYRDEDADGAGAPGVPSFHCPAPGWSITSDDCDDTDPGISGPEDWYEDNDGDGVGGQWLGEVGCVPPAGAVNASGDCDDADPSLIFDCTPQTTTGPTGSSPSDPSADDAFPTKARTPPAPPFGFGCATSATPPAGSSLVAWLAIVSGLWLRPRVQRFHR